MGCTIGAVFTQGNGLLIFKNRDLPVRKENPQPEVVRGESYNYIKFGVDIEGRKLGVWAGINERGVGIVGADGNSIADVHGEGYGGGEKTWEAYENVLGMARNIQDGYEYIMRFYEQEKIGGTGDIVLIADQNRAVVLEYSLHQWGLQFANRGEMPYVVRTNFFAVLKHLRPAKEDGGLHSSSDVRYERALQLLSATGVRTTVADIKRLCRDHFYGQNAFSICRHGGEGEYRTVCSAIMEASSNRIAAHCVLNSLPSEDEYQWIE